jgi:hypothetical protein
MSDMALTEGRVGYMLPMLVLDVGETLLAACAAPGECWEPYDMTLEAGVRAGVSALDEPMAVA